MKTTTTIFLAAAISAVWLPVFAQNHMMGGQGMSQSMMHSQGMSQSTMNGQGMSQSSMSMMPLREQMQAMQQQMDKIQTTGNPEERKSLLNDHMIAMHRAMGMMGADGMMQHPGMHAGTGNDADNAAAAPMQHCTEDTAQCRQLNQMADMQQRMGQRMNMMQMMMQQMLEHEAASEQDEDD